MGIAALDLDMRPHWEAYKRKRDLIFSGLQNHYEVRKPGGAFYIFPSAPGGDGDAFCQEAIRNELLIVPGSVFSEKKTNFRISFAAPDETIQRGVEILKRMAG
jgi:aspartate aminotransferase/aminotransferase